MVDNIKQSSNVTNLAFAEELTIGVLPGSPVWNRLTPNSYSDFGGEFVKSTPNPITNTRQRNKGVISDLNASGGFNQNLSVHNQKELMQGFMFANLRRVRRAACTVVVDGGAGADSFTVPATGVDVPNGFNTAVIVGNLIRGFNFANAQNNANFPVTAVTGTSISVATGSLVAEATAPANAYVQVVGYEFPSGDLSVTLSGNYAIYTSATKNPTTLGLYPGQWIFVGGDLTTDKFTVQTSCNGFKRIRSVNSTSFTVDRSSVTMVADTGTGKLIKIFYGDVLKNELDPDIKLRSYHLERTLGPSVAGSVNLQSEVLKGSVPNQFTLSIPTSDIVNTDLSFVSTNYVTNASIDAPVPGTGPLQTGVIDPPNADVFNSVSDVSRMKMAIHSATDANPAALFAFLTEAKITINNNVTPLKAIGTLGAFDINVGNFDVSGTVTAYFANVAAVDAIRNNSTVSFDFALVKNNMGMLIDLPLVSLGDGRLNVALNQPITLPLSLDAAQATDIASTFTHTALFNYFNFLPTAAD